MSGHARSAVLFSVNLQPSGRGEASQREAGAAVGAVGYRRVRTHLTLMRRAAKFARLAKSAAAACASAEAPDSTRATSGSAASSVRVSWSSLILSVSAKHVHVSGVRVLHTAGRVQAGARVRGGAAFLTAFALSKKSADVMRLQIRSLYSCATCSGNTRLVGEEEPQPPGAKRVSRRRRALLTAAGCLFESLDNIWKLLWSRGHFTIPTTLGCSC